MNSTAIDRRRFVIGAAFIAAAPVRTFIDGQSVVLDGREYCLTDIVAPSPAPLSGPPDPGAEFARIVLNEVQARGALMADASATVDRWGRLTGAVRWRISGGRETTLQEILVAQGAARVAPQSQDFDLIDRCYAAEKIARENVLGLWAHKTYRIRDANRAETANGFQIYEGEIRNAGEHGARTYFNFGDNYRDDFTASVPRALYRRWKLKINPAATIGKRAQVRGFVERINGPSIELLNEKQLRIL